MRYGFGCLVLAPLTWLVFAPPAFAVTHLTVSNAPTDFSDPGASNLNVQDLEDALPFTNVLLNADETVSVIDEAILSERPDGGPTLGSLTFDTLTVHLDQSLTLGAGTLTVNADVVHLTGSAFFDDGVSSGLMGAGKLSGTASEVNVLATTASIEQAVLIADALASVSVLDGAFADVSVDKGLSFRVAGIASVSFASGVLDAGELLADDSASIEIFGSGFEVDTGSGFAPVAPGALSASTGTLRGVLDSGDPFELAFSQGGGAHTGSIVLVPEPSTLPLLLSGMAGLAARSRAQVRSRQR